MGTKESKIILITIFIQNMIAKMIKSIIHVRWSRFSLDLKFDVLKKYHKWKKQVKRSMYKNFGDFILKIVTLAQYELRNFIRKYVGPRLDKHAYQFNTK
jgi:hypothetical protein